MPASAEVGGWPQNTLGGQFVTYVEILISYIYIYMLPPPSDLPFVAFIAWKPPELLK